jgi:hypothetical protein
VCCWYRCSKAGVQSGNWRVSLASFVAPNMLGNFVKAGRKGLAHPAAPGGMWTGGAVDVSLAGGGLGGGEAAEGSGSVRGIDGAAGWSASASVTAPKPRHALARLSLSSLVTRPNPACTEREGGEVGRGVTMEVPAFESWCRPCHCCIGWAVLSCSGSAHSSSL